MVDLIQEAIQSGHVVVWEEVARDGAQAKTLLTGQQRVRIAHLQSIVFGQYASSHLVFAAGFPSLCQEEFDAIRQVVAEVDTCSLATHGRAIKRDIDLGIEAMKDARYGRVSFALPISEKHSQIMMHQSRVETLQHGLALARYALDKAQGIPIDIALATASRVEPEFLADAVAALTEEGIATIKICDTTGELFPCEVYWLFKRVLTRVPSQVAIGAHLHNDLGLALANNLEAIRAGARLMASSWLGLGERNGLVATEQLLFVLVHKSAHLATLLEIDSPLWLKPPNLSQLTHAAQMVSQMLEVPLKVTDPIVGTGMNQIATGSTLNDPLAFRPFDPEEVLGIPQRLVLSHLANRKIVWAIANDLGYQLDPELTFTALNWVKTYAYSQGSSIVPLSAFADFLASITASH